MEDGLDSLFAPDVLTPSQFADLRRSVNGDDAPIKRLMLAVLDLTLRDATKAPSTPRAKKRWATLYAQHARCARERAAEAQAWIFDDGGDGPFSFRTCCETLEIDGERL